MLDEYEQLKTHKDKTDYVYKKAKFPEAVDLWASYFARDKIDVRYSNWRHLNPRRQEIENRIWRKIIKPGNSVLDIGCGKGFFLKRIYDSFGDAVSYTGIDISPTVIHEAVTYFSYPDYYVGDAENLPFRDNSFDYVQLISTLTHVQNIQNTLGEAHRVLKEGGYLFIVIHKRHVDPLIVSNVYGSLKKLIKKSSDKVTVAPRSYNSTRRNMFQSLTKDTFKYIERGDLVAHVNMYFYRKVHVPVELLFGIVSIVNKLPVGIFKDLEYRVYQKCVKVK